MRSTPNPFTGKPDFYGAAPDEILEAQTIDLTNIQCGSVNVTKAQVVFSSNATGSLIIVKPAIATTVGHVAGVLGFTTAALNTGNNGTAITRGVLDGVKTDTDSDGNSLMVGDILYLSASVSGGYTKVAPASPFRRRLGIVLEAHATTGKIFVEVVHAIAQAELLDGGQQTNHDTGFEDPENVGVSYDRTNRTITLTHSSGTIAWYYRGQRFTAASPWTSAAHTNSTNGYYLTMDGATTTQAWSTSPWAFTQVMVAFVHYDSASAANTFAARETHGTMNWQAHQEYHETLGSYWRSGLGLTAGTYAVYTSSTAPTSVNDNTPGVDVGTTKDEDLITTIPVLTQGTYTTAYRSGAAGDWVFSVVDTTPYFVNTNTIRYNQWTGATWQLTNLTEDQFVNIFDYVIPVAGDSDSQKYRHVWITGQTSHGTLAAAQAELPTALSLGTLSSLFAEATCVNRLTYQFNASGPGSVGAGVSGRCKIMSADPIRGTGRNQVAIIGSTPVLSTAESISLDTSTFDKNLSAAITNVQLLAEAVDELVLGGGGGAATPWVLGMALKAGSFYTYNKNVYIAPADATSTTSFNADIDARRLEYTGIPVYLTEDMSTVAGKVGNIAYSSVNETFYQLRGNATVNPPYVFSAPSGRWAGIAGKYVEVPAVSNISNYTASVLYQPGNQLNVTAVGYEGIWIVNSAFTSSVWATDMANCTKIANVGSGGTADPIVIESAATVDISGSVFTSYIVKSGGTLRLTADATIYGDVKLLGTLNMQSFGLTVNGSIIGNTGTITAAPTAAKTLAVYGDYNSQLTHTPTGSGRLSVTIHGTAYLQGGLAVNGASGTTGIDGGTLLFRGPVFSTAAVSTTGGNGSGGAGGNGGAITFTSSAQIQGNVTSSGGTGTTNGGVGGTISFNGSFVTSGNITSSGGSSSSTSAGVGGAGGAVIAKSSSGFCPGITTSGGAATGTNSKGGAGANITVYGDVYVGGLILMSAGASSANPTSAVGSNSGRLDHYFGTLRCGGLTGNGGVANTSTGAGGDSGYYNAISKHCILDCFGVIQFRSGNGSLCGLIRGSYYGMVYIDEYLELAFGTGDASMRGEPSYIYKSMTCTELLFPTTPNGVGLQSQVGAEFSCSFEGTGGVFLIDTADGTLTSPTNLRYYERAGKWRAYA